MDHLLRQGLSLRDSTLLCGWCLPEKVMEKLVERVKGLLRFEGKRLTKQRRVIIRAIETMEGHFDVYELHRKVEEADHRISLSTVYRTLNLLKEMGLVRELDLGEGYTVYEIVRDLEHHHLICIRCGRIVEFHCAHCEATHRRLAEKYGFEIVSSQVVLQGYCPQCREELERGR